MDRLLPLIAAAVLAADPAPQAFTDADAEAVLGAGALKEADAKAKYDGKRVEIVVLRPYLRKDHDAGDRAGQAEFAVVPNEEKAAKRHHMTGFVKDELDAGTLRNLYTFNGKPIRLRGTVKVDYARPGKATFDDLRIVRTEEERAAETKRVEAGRQALRDMAKAKDGKALRLTAAVQKALTRIDAKNAEIAKAWDGKEVEYVTSGASASQEQKDDAGKPRTMFNFVLPETPEPEWVLATRLVAYMTDAKDIASVNNKGHWPKPYPMRGTLRKDPKSKRWSVEEARLVRDPAEAKKEADAVAAGRAALEKPAKTADGKALVLTPTAGRGMRWRDAENLRLAKTWDGKEVELEARQVTASQKPATSGDYKGQSMIDVAIQEPDFKWEGRVLMSLAVADEKDVEALKGLGYGGKKGLRVRGTFRAKSNASGPWFVLEGAKVVKE